MKPSASCLGHHPTSPWIQHRHLRELGKPIWSLGSISCVRRRIIHYKKGKNINEGGICRVSGRWPWLCTQSSQFSPQNVERELLQEISFMRNIKPRPPRPSAGLSGRLSRSGDNSVTSRLCFRRHPRQAHFLPCHGHHINSAFVALSLQNTGPTMA